MSRIRFTSTFTIAMIAANAAFAQSVSNSHGGDEFVAGSGVNQTFEARRDVFAAGNSVTVKGASGGDAHIVGFDVDIESATGADLYAAGGAVTVRGPVAEDRTATGFSVRTSESAVTNRNTRLFGGTLVV